MIDKNKFTALDSICYDLATYDLSQLKLKSGKVYTNQVAKLVSIANPTDDDIIEALFVSYQNKTTGSIYRKFEKLCKVGILAAN